MLSMLDDVWFRLLLGLAGGMLIAVSAYRKSSLSRSGAWSAALMGTGYVVLGGPVWFGTLLAFFISSTAWSKWKRHTRAKQSAEANYAKSGRRDAVQVWANGGLGLGLCAAHALWPDPIWLYAYVGVMAAVNADTWATEVGALSKKAPRSVLTGAIVSPGTSGGVTWLGTMAALSGALFIGCCAALLCLVGPISVFGAGLGEQTVLGAPRLAWLIGVAGLSGLAGAFADSLLGATVQAMYRCNVCSAETERRTHCGHSAAPLRGWTWMTNDAVNMLSSILAGAVAVIFMQL